MELVKEPIRPLSNICESSVVLSKTTGTRGSLLLSTPKTRGLQQLPNVPRSIYS
jgi:hypothetical protein